MGTIRILEFIPGFGWHGITERMLAHSHNILEKGGEVHWISMQPGRPEWLVDDRIQFHHVTSSGRGEPTQPFAGLGARHPLRQYQTAREIARLIEQLRPDQLNCWSGQTAWIATVARHWFCNAEMKRVNLIYHESYRSPLRISMSCWQRRLMDRHLEAIEVSHSSIQQELRAEGFRQRIEVADMFPVAADSVLIDERGGQPTALRTELRMVSHHRLRSRLSLPESTFLAGAAAPLVPRTRLKDLIWATDLLNVFLDHFHLVVWGTGTQQRDLQRFVEQTEAADCIHFLQEGRAGGEELAGLDCFWQAHLLEPSAPAMLKAMSLGIPVIAVAGQGTDEWVRHQQTGFSVNFGARDEFARWTKFLMEQAAAATQIADQGRRWIDLKARATTCH